MALDPDNLLELVRTSLTAALTNPSKIRTAFEAFGRLDEALCAGNDLPEDWLTEPAPDGEIDDGAAEGEGDPDDDAEDDPEMRALRGGGE